MRWVKYVPIGQCYSRLTKDKIYEVCHYKPGSEDSIMGYEEDYIQVLNDEGNLDFFYVFAFDGVPEFIDVTAEHRVDIIDGILE